MREVIHKLWGRVAELLFPRACFGCGKPNSYFCGACRGQFRPHSFTTDSGIRVFAAHPYHHSAIQKALLQLKYRGSRDIADSLAEMLANALPANVRATRDAEIVAVPITNARQKGRGYNQAELLGRALAAKLNLPFVNALEKIRETPPQATLNRAARLSNLRGAFVARADYAPRRTVIIVDDISTTGATLTEAARALRKKSAATIIGAVVAHG